MSKYVINCGHCVSGSFDFGASGNGYKEQDLTRVVGNLVMAKLKAQGHTVTNATVDSASSVINALSKICAIEKSANADMFVSIHLNAFNKSASGTEVFTYGAKEIPQARNILNNIVSMGFTNRGIKDGKGLYVVHNTKSTAMLVELCFIDSNDMKMFNAEKMANAIVLGLTGKAVSTKPVATTPKTTFYVRLSFNNTKSEIGHFDDLYKAKEFANNHIGYKVFDSKGKYVYELAGAFRVMKDWNDDSMLACFDNLYKAKDYANLHVGYKVFDPTGKYVYELAVIKPTPVVADDTTYQVVSGSFSNRENADKQVEELKKEGIDSFISIKK